MNINVKYRKPIYFQNSNGTTYKVLATYSNNAVMESEKAYYAVFNIDGHEWAYSKFLGFKTSEKINPYVLARYIKLIMK